MMLPHFADEKTSAHCSDPLKMGGVGKWESRIRNQAFPGLSRTLWFPQNLNY